MTDFESYETCSRVLTAVFAAYDLKPGANLDRIIGYYGTEATKQGLRNYLRSIKKDAEQMKQQDISDGSQSSSTTEAAKPAKTTKSTKSAKASNSKDSAEKEDPVTKGRVKKATNPASKRVAKKKLSEKFAVVAENGSMSEDELPEETNESEVLVKEDGTPKIAEPAIEVNGMSEGEGHEDMNGTEVQMKQEDASETATATEGDGMVGKDGLKEVNGNVEYVKEKPDEMSGNDMDVDKASEVN